MISSLRNDKVKLVRALQSRAKTRRAEQKIVLEGVRLVREACEHGARPDFILYTPGSAAGELLTWLDDNHHTLIPVSDEVMAYSSDTEQPQGIVAVAALPALPLPDEPRAVLIVDALRNPGNLGTLLRSAAAAGVDCVLLAPGCVDAFNPKVLRGAMGAHFRLPLATQSWAQIAEYCTGLSVYLADSAGDARYDEADWSGGWALIIGGEAHGASAEAVELARARVSIPMVAGSESLNAAVAGGILLFEARRQGQTPFC